MVNYGLKDKVALITGANNPQGIGATTALICTRFFVTLVNTEVTTSRKWKEKRVFILHFSRLFVTLREFAGFLSIKAVWRIEENTGYDLETVLNSTFFHLKVEVWRCNLLWNVFNEHPMMCHQPFYDSSSDAKVNRLSEMTKHLKKFSPILLWFHVFVLPLHT